MLCVTPYLLQAKVLVSAYIDILVMYLFHKTHMIAEFKIPYPASTLKTQILSSQNSTPTFMQITFFVSKITTKSKKNGVKQTKNTAELTKVTGLKSSLFR